MPVTALVDVHGFRSSRGAAAPPDEWSDDARPKRTTAVRALGIGVSQGQDARFRS